MSIYGQRPDRPAPPGQTKQPLDVVFAASVDGRLFELPTEIASRYEVTAERVRELGDVPPIATPVEEGEEVGGRHMMQLPDGTTRYHGNWVSGAYVWHKDYRSYSGPHWHPDRNSPLAHDMQDY